MPENNFNIWSYSGNKISVDPADIKAQGEESYPRLIIPTKLTLSPIQAQTGGEKAFSILSVSTKLFLNSQTKIADAIPWAFAHTVRRSEGFPRGEQSSRMDIEFPLTPLQLDQIEKVRKGGDIVFRLFAWLTIGIFDPLIVTTNGSQEHKDFLSSVETVFAELVNLTIPQSHWVLNILPNLGGNKYILVEIPESSKILTKAWEYIDQAERAFGRWDIATIGSKCREVGDLLDGELSEKLGKGYDYNERWERTYKLFKHLASLGLHNEEIGKKYSGEERRTTRADAELLLILAKSLIRFVEELLREKDQLRA